jgi:hypothetical protein
VQIFVGKIGKGWQRKASSEERAMTCSEQPSGALLNNIIASTSQRQAAPLLLPSLNYSVKNATVVKPHQKKKSNHLQTNFISNG